MRPGKKFILLSFLVLVVLLGSLMGAACSSDDDVAEELDGGSQDGGPGGDMSPEGMAPGMGLSEDLLARVAEILNVDQEDLADAFEQAQEEMTEDMPEGMEDMPGDGEPPEDMSPEDVPEDMPEGGMPPGDMREGGMVPGMGLSEDLLARVAEILGIDQEELADAVEQAQEEMASETVPPGSD